VVGAACKPLPPLPSAGLTGRSTSESTCCFTRARQVVELVVDQLLPHLLREFDQ
jgi:hypothetical protein